MSLSRSARAWFGVEATVGLAALVVAVAGMAILTHRTASIIRPKAGSVPKEIKGSANCGPACLYLIAKREGLACSLDELSDRAGVNAMGTTMLRLKETAEELGFQATAYTGTFQQLCRLLAAEHSYAILHVKPEHFVAAVTTVDLGLIRIADPSRGVIDVNAQGLQDLYEWEGTMLLIVKKETT